MANHSGAAEHRPRVHSPRRIGSRTPVSVVLAVAALAVLIGPRITRAQTYDELFRTLRGPTSVEIAASRHDPEGIASAPPVPNLDIAIRQSLMTSPALQADNARQDAASARLRGSVDAFMPTVAWVQERRLTSKISYNPELSLQTADGLDTTERREPNAFGIQASAPLFDGFKRYNNFRSAQLAARAGEYLQTEKREQVILDTAVAYLAVLRDRKIVAFRQRQVGDLAAIAKRTGARLATRDATHADAEISNSRVLSAQIALQQAQVNLDSSKIELQRLTGTEPGQMTEPQVPDTLVPATAEQLREMLLQSNPKLAAARLDSRAAGHLADAARADILPQVNLVVSHMEQKDVSEAVNRVRDTTVKLQMRVPLYEPGATSRIDEVSATARQKAWDVVDAQAQGIATMTSLFQQRLSTIAQLRNADQRIRTMQSAVESYRVESQEGLRTIIDILNAQNELAEAQIMKANLEFLRGRQTFELAAALGRLGTMHMAATRPAAAPAQALSLTR